MFNGFEIACITYVEVHRFLNTSQLFSSFTYVNFDMLASRIENEKCLHRSSVIKGGYIPDFLVLMLEMNHLQNLDILCRSGDMESQI